MPDQNIPTHISPRLIIEGVDRAIAFYRSVFGAELLERYAAPDGLVVHAEMRIGASTFSLAEQVRAWGQHAPPAVGGSPVLLHLTLPDPDAVCQRLVAEGGEVVVPIDDRFYGKREGRARDPFGHLWILSRPLEELSRKELERRVAQLGSQEP